MRSPFLQKSIVVLLLLLVSTVLSNYRVELLSENESGTVLKMSLEKYRIDSIKVGDEMLNKVILQGGVYNQPKGNPDIPAIVQSIIIPDTAEMTWEIISTTCEKISVQRIIPSKGSISRKVNPADVPFEFGPVYSEEGLYPLSPVSLGRPYIVRDYRANTVSFYPFSYNTGTGELNITKEIVVRVYPTDKRGENVKKRTRSRKKDSFFQTIYGRRFLNFQSSRYTPLEEDGDMLIISYGSFISAVEPLAEWKNRKGIKTEIVDVADIGNSDAIRTFVKNYYDSTDLKYLLLVGDYKEVPNATSISPEDQKPDPSDNQYGCIEGDDSYVEVFVGRLSGTTLEHIEDQVDKLLHYERKLNSSDTWLNNGLGSADQSEEDDKDVVDHITQELKDYTYKTVNYYQGKYQDDTQIVGWTNEGYGVFGVSTHASQTAISGLNSNSVNKMINEGMYPVNFTLGCDPGDFTFSDSRDCLGEALLKKKKAGYIGAFMASISQPWYEPYSGLREFFDIITEQYPSNHKITYGGIAGNGCMKMIDDFSGGSGAWVADTWILFGDPSLAVYTDLPKDIEVAHPEVIGLGTQTVTITGTDGTTVALYSQSQGIQQSAVITNGKVDISIDVKNLDTIYVTGTGFNLQTYEGIITIESGPYISVSSPTGGAKLNYEDTVDIKWKLGGGAEAKRVTLSYSTDNGASWESIKEDVNAESVSLTWSIPDVFGSDSCIVKVADDESDLSGESARFSIVRDPIINTGKEELSVYLELEETKEIELDIHNDGKGVLEYSIRNTNTKAAIVINELFISHTAFFDGVELWNRGEECSMAGWKLVWMDSDNSSGEYTFPDDYVMKEGETVILTDEEEANDNKTLYVGLNLLWSSQTKVEMSIALYNPAGEVVDYVRTNGSTEEIPDGALWEGDGVICQNDRIYRNSNDDKNTAEDWSYGDGESSVNQINPGQSLDVTVASWLVMDKKEGTVSGLEKEKVTIKINSEGLDLGNYHDTLVITHNDPQKESPIRIPFLLEMVETGILDEIPDGTQSGIFCASPSIARIHDRSIRFFWNGIETDQLEICIYDALGDAIHSVTAPRDEVTCLWDLTSKKGYKVSSGSYIAIVKATDKNGVSSYYKTVVGVQK